MPRDRTRRDRVGFIRSQTRRAPVPLVPEIEIHAATELSPLWAQTQTFLDQQEIDPPYWAFPWAGGQALARYVLDEPDVVAGRRVLDFACGSALVAIAAMLAGAAHALAADIDPLACAAARLNAEAAGVRVEATRRDLVGDPLEGVDVVLVGDVFYEEKPAARFDRWLRDLATSGRLVLVGDPGRAYLPRDLERLATRRVPVSFDIESAEAKSTSIYRYRAAP